MSQRMISVDAADFHSLQERMHDMERKLTNITMSPNISGLQSPLPPSPMVRASLQQPQPTPPEPQGAFAYAQAISLSLSTNSPDREWTQLAETIRHLQARLAEESSARNQAEVQLAASKAQLFTLLGEAEEMSGRHEAEQRNLFDSVKRTGHTATTGVGNRVFCVSRFLFVVSLLLSTIGVSAAVLLFAR